MSGVRGKFLLRTALLGAVGVALVACAEPSLPPVINKTPNRVIPVSAVARADDSIYTIAWRYGLDYQDIAEWNQLIRPYRIRKGQRLRLLAPGAKAPARTTQKTKVKKTVQVAKPPTKTAGSKTAKTTKTAKAKPQKTTTKTTAKTATKTKTPTKTPRPAAGAPKRWRWPAQGELIGKFSRSGGQNGIRIAGKAGSPVRATAAGEVVYAGDGLRGYGNLIIIEHSPAYLSAYAHNRKLLVREGARIKSGQRIAQMGNSGADRVMLHFEIRRRGKPVDPLKFLK